MRHTVVTSEKVSIAPGERQVRVSIFNGSFC